MIRVAFGSVPKDGGTFTFYRNLRPALLQHGIDLRCVSVGRDQAAMTEEQFVDDGCVQLASRTTDLKRQSKRFARWCADEGMHIVVGVNSPAILSALPHLAKEIRVVARCANGFDEGYRLTMMGHSRLARIVALVPRLKEDLEKGFGADPSSIVLIPNGVSPEQFADAAARRRGIAKALSLGFLGRLEHSQKGVMHIPPVLEKLEAQGVNYQLRIAGKGKHEAELRAALATHVEDGRVSFVGTLAPSQIPTFLGETDVFLFPSHFEGCPNALLEAMMAGAVPVSWRLRGITDFLLKHERDGFLLDTGDTTAFAKAISDLANNPAVLERMSKAVADEARSRFSTDTCALAYVRVFSEVMRFPAPEYQPLPWSEFKIDPLFRQNPLSRLLTQNQRQNVKAKLAQMKRVARLPSVAALKSPAKAINRSQRRVHQIINSIAHDRGGAERVVRDLHRGLLSAGLDSRLVSLESCALTNLEAATSLELTGPYDPRALLRLGAYAREIGPNDIVHVHLFPASAYAAALAQSGRLNCRFVFTEHSTSNRRRGNALGEFVDRQVYRAYEKIVAISKGVEKELLLARPWLQGRTTTVENGSILPFNEPPQRLVGDVTRIVSVGRLTPAKNYDRAIDAMALLKGRNFRYTIAGEGPLRLKLESHVARRGLSDIIDLPGFVQDVPGLLRSADVFFIPSEWEGFGLAAVEAMNAALPIIASDIPGLGDVVGSEGGAALRIDPKDVDGMAQALSRLIDDPELRLAIGARGFERSKDFSFDRCLDEYIALYRSLWETPRDAA